MYSYSLDSLETHINILLLLKVCIYIHIYTKMSVINLALKVLNGDDQSKIY